jgi:hypothetical protein
VKERSVISKIDRWFEKSKLQKRLKENLTTPIKEVRKMLSCDHCDKTSIDKYHLSRHQIVHNKLRAFKCALCSKVFSQIGSLKIDMLHLYMKSVQLLSVTSVTKYLLPTHIYLYIKLFTINWGLLNVLCVAKHFPRLAAIIDILEHMKIFPKFRKNVWVVTKHWKVKLPDNCVTNVTYY